MPDTLAEATGLFVGTGERDGGSGVLSGRERECAGHAASDTGAGGKSEAIVMTCFCGEEGRESVTLDCRGHALTVVDHAQL